MWHARFVGLERGFQMLKGSLTVSLYGNSPSGYHGNSIAYLGTCCLKSSDVVFAEEKRF